MQRGLKIAACIAIVIAVIISIITVFGLIEQFIDKKNSAGDVLQYTNTGDNSTYYNGKKYIPNDYLESLLLIGTDALDGDSGNKYSQADFIAILLIDRFDKEFCFLHINRDTVADITQLDAKDNNIGTFKGQVALAYAYGSSGEIQCRNTVAAIEKLLFDVDIDYYLSMTMDALPLFNDSIGGVTLTLENDFPVLGETFTKGKQVTLNGEQALTFVRWRDNDPQNSNLERMERQRHYIRAISDKFGKDMPEIDSKTILELNEHIVSNCSVNRLSDFIKLFSGYEYKGIITLDGETEKNGTFVEYHIDEEAAKATVIDLFYREIKE